METDEYSKILSDVEKLFEISYNLSYSLNNIITTNRQQATASQILVKIVLNTGCILKILPNSKYSNSTLTIWDISSVGSLTRNFIESSNVLYYLCIEKTTVQEVDFRYKLYELRTCAELLSMVRSMGSVEEKNQDLIIQYNQLSSSLSKDTFFLSLSAGLQKELLKAKKGFYLNHNEITERRGIDIDLFKGVYKFLSVHTHTAPHSIEQIRTLKLVGNENESTKMFISLVLNHCCHYLARTIIEVAELFSNKINFNYDLEFVTNYSRELSSQEK